jgi:hypothetical protein
MLMSVAEDLIQALDWAGFGDRPWLLSGCTARGAPAVEAGLVWSLGKLRRAATIGFLGD